MEPRNSSSQLSAEARNRKTYSPLHLAVFNNDAEMVEKLLKNGASDACINDEGKTALELACDLGHYDCAEKFDKWLTDYIDETDGKWGRLFLYAIEYNKIDLLKKLHQAGASTAARTRKERNTALHHAVTNYSHEAIKFLLSIGASLTVVNKYGNTPINTAVNEKNYESAALLIQSVDKAAALADKEDQLHLTAALSNAIYGKHLDTIRLLLEHGAPVNKHSCFGNEALFAAMAVAVQHPEILILLLQHGADPSLLDNHGRDLYTRMIASGDLKQANLLRPYHRGVSPELLSGFETEISERFLKVQSPDNDTKTTVVELLIYYAMLRTLFQHDIQELSAKRNLLNLNRSEYDAEINDLDMQIRYLQQLEAHPFYAAENDASFNGTRIGFHLADHFKRLALIQEFHGRIETYLLELKNKINQGQWQIKSFMETFTNKWHQGMPKHMQFMLGALNKLNNDSSVLDTLAVYIQVRELLENIPKDGNRHAETSAFYLAEMKNIADLPFLPKVQLAIANRN